MSKRVWSLAVCPIALFPIICPTSAADRPGIREELAEHQRRTGTSLAMVEDTAIWRLNFGTRMLEKLMDVPEQRTPWTRHSLLWDHDRLAGNSREALWIADLHTKQVSEFPGMGTLDMTFSHDGKQLAFVSSTRKGERQLGVWLLSCGTGRQELVGTDATWRTVPQWSPNDSLICYHTEQAKVVSLDLTTRLRQTHARGEVPSWLDNVRLVYQRTMPQGVRTRRQYWVRELDTGTDRLLIDDRSAWCEVLDEPLRISDDGKWGVFLRGWTDWRLVEHADVVVIRMKDGNLSTVYSRPFGRQLPITWIVSKEDKGVRRE